MRRSPITRRLLATTLPAALVLGSVSSTAIAEPIFAQNMSTYGMPGGIDTPTAEMMPDGTLGGTISKSDYAQRNNVIFQALPRLTTALRYSKVEGINDHNDLGHIWDRSFDLRFQMLDEDAEGWRPAVAVGLQDFMGTGVYSGDADLRDDFAVLGLADRFEAHAAEERLGTGVAGLVDHVHVVDAAPARLGRCWLGHACG